MSAVDIEYLQRWVGSTQERNDVIAAAPVAALSATLDCEQPLARAGEALPACWHWLYFHDAVPASKLGADGHPRRGDFLPPVPLPRRMWAGGRLRFLHPLRVGDAVRRQSTVSAISHKQGRAGELVFVTARHQLFRGQTLALEEEQDLVYRAPAPVSTASPAPAELPVAQWSRKVLPDPVLLFRYSALTFNAHRIHYDRDYAVREEGYPALVVQGPLTVTLLLELLRREAPAASIAGLSFRALGPLFEGAPLQLQGRRDGNAARLWASGVEGALAMEIRVDLGSP